MDLPGRLMAAMQALDSVERNVRACQAAARTSNFDTDHADLGPMAKGVPMDDMATANLEAVLKRRKELGRWYGLGLEGIQAAAGQVEVEKLLKPLKLNDMAGWGGGSNGYDGDNILTSTPEQEPRTAKLKAPVAITAPKTPASKPKRVRQRKPSGGQYSSGHISKIFDPQDAIARTTRSSRVVEVEDDDDDDDSQEEEEDELEAPLERALSVASTGSNIVVYRPPSVIMNEVPPGDTKRPAPLRKKAPVKRPPSSRQRAPPSRKQQKQRSVISVSSRETVDIDRLGEVEDTPDVLQGNSKIVSTGTRQEDQNAPLLSSPGSIGKIQKMVDDTGTQRAEQNLVTLDQPSANTSELSFATSNGTGLFISDKRRPKKPRVEIAEGTVLGGSDSNIFFPIPSPGPEDISLADTVRVNQDSNITPKKKSKKRKSVPTADLSDPSSSSSKKTKGSGKSAIGVGDLVSASSRRARPSRATMRNGEGLLIGTSGVGDVASSAPTLSWRSKGRGKGVTRALPLGEMAKKSDKEGLE